MQNLIVSMMRFSAAITLFGMEQVQHTLNLMEGEEDLSKTMERLEKALNSMTDALVARIDDKKKDTLGSVTRMSEDIVSRTVDGMSVVNPTELYKAANDLLQKTTEATADLMSKAASAVGKATDTAKTEEQAQPVA